MEAEIILECGDAKTAETIAKAVSPDNFKTPRGLFIKTIKRGQKVLTKVRCDGKMATFIATIDDFLFCVSIAEKALQTTKILNEKNKGS